MLSIRLQRGYSTQLSPWLEPSGIAHVIALVICNVPGGTDMLGLSDSAGRSSLWPHGILQHVVGT